MGESETRRRSAVRCGGEVAGGSNSVDPVSVRAAVWAVCGRGKSMGAGKDHGFHLLRIDVLIQMAEEFRAKNPPPPGAKMPKGYKGTQ